MSEVTCAHCGGAMNLLPINKEIRCSFCNALVTDEATRWMIQGPHGIHICNNCVDTCLDIIKEADRGKTEAAP